MVRAVGNAAEVVDGEPEVLRSTAGRLASPAGEVVAVASEHDDVAGTARGPNTIFCLGLSGLRLCHMGDFGQPALRPEQRAAIGEVDVLFLPVGGGPTIGGGTAAAVVGGNTPRPGVPRHHPPQAPALLQPPPAVGAARGGAGG